MAKKYALQRIRLPIIRYHKKVSLYDQKEHGLLEDKVAKKVGFLEKQAQLVYYDDEQDYVEHKNEVELVSSVVPIQKQGLCISLHEDPY